MPQALVIGLVASIFFFFGPLRTILVEIQRISRVSEALARWRGAWHEGRGPVAVVCTSQRPRYDLVETQEAAQWIRNLCGQFDRASVAQCLEISLEQIQEVLKSTQEVQTTASRLLKHEAVIWDRALHFLVRDPRGDMAAELVYKGKVRKELSVQLLPKNHKGAALKGGSKGCSLVPRCS